MTYSYSYSCYSILADPSLVCDLSRYGRCGFEQDHTDSRDWQLLIAQDSAFNAPVRDSSGQPGMERYDDVIKWKHFRVIDHLCGKFTGDWRILRTKASDAELWCFLWSAPWLNGWVINAEAGDLRRHRSHYADSNKCIGWTTKSSNISCTLAGNNIVDHPDVGGASPVGAAPTTSPLST